MYYNLNLKYRSLKDKNCFAKFSLVRACEINITRFRMLIKEICREREKKNQTTITAKIKCGSKVQNAYILHTNAEEVPQRRRVSF